MTSTGSKVFLVTGANTGIGLEATRQLAAQQNTKVYMICRSKERATVALSELGNPTNVAFIPFDCYKVSNTIANQIQEETVTGVLLNAGGFGESCDASTDHGPSKLAKLNLMGHVSLIKQLISENKLREGSRIVASGSEATITGPQLDWHTADFQLHLQGRNKDHLNKYAWIKGMIAFYWAAFARHPTGPELFVVTVSPGAVKNTQLFQQQGVPIVAKHAAVVAMFFMGKHSLQEGAQRYVDALLNQGTCQDVPSGSFLAHRKGYAKDFGNVLNIKRGKVFGDTQLQDKVWEAVESILAMDGEN